jgi:hypothetical protein
MNLQENIQRIKEMMGIKESFVAGVWGDENDNYSIDKLVKLVKGRKPEEMNIDNIIDKNKDLETKEGNFYDNIIEPTELFKKRTMKSNTDYPIMVSREGWIIDGSHRVAKQKWEGKDKIKVHVISKKDLKRAKITDNSELEKSEKIDY